MRADSDDTKMEMISKMTLKPDKDDLEKENDSEDRENDEMIKT